MAAKKPILAPLILAALAALSLYFSGEAIYRSEQIEQARTVADMVDNIGSWASKYRGIWVKTNKGQNTDLGSHLDTLVVSTSIANYSEISSEEANDLLMFHLKNPALIQREIADLTEKSKSATKFRITADKYMNPKNAPNAFEKSAMKAMRDSNKTEYTQVRDGQLRYARALIATEACMRCHDTPAKAPAAVRNLYPDQGYGYEVGKVAGVIAVSVPYQYTPIRLAKTLSPQAWLFITGLLFGLLILSRRRESTHLEN